MPQYKIGDSRNGKGVFAAANFKKGAQILQFRGELCTLEHVPKPYHPLADHYLPISKTLFIGPSGQADDYVNHSCNPNCGIKSLNDKYFLVAIKNIKKGAEITYDYSTAMDEDGRWEIECRCGSKNCRKTVRDFKYLPRELQAKYLKLGIVLDYVRHGLHR